MLVITRKQMELFEAAVAERFAKECTLNLRHDFAAWTQDKSEDDLDQFVREMIRFSKDHGIEKEHNIRKLMVLKIRYDYQLPLSKSLQSTLLPTDQDEDYRMDRFSKALEPQVNDLIQISLEDDTQLLKREYTRNGTGKWQG